LSPVCENTDSENKLDSRFYYYRTSGAATTELARKFSSALGCIPERVVGCPEAVRLLGLPDMPEIKDYSDHYRLSAILKSQWKCPGKHGFIKSRLTLQMWNNIWCPISLEEYFIGIIYFRGVYIKRNTGKFMSEILPGHQLGRAFHVHLEGSTGLS
jgi:hypothetical protein